MPQPPNQPLETHARTMAHSPRSLAFALVIAALAGLCLGSPAQAITVAEWNFPSGPTSPVNSYTWQADAGSLSGSASLEAYIGAAEKDGEQNLNAENGQVTWLDLKGGGDDWDDPRTGSPNVEVDKDGTVETTDFGNDALVYLVLDGTGLSNFTISIDALLDSDSDKHVTSMDFFYRVSATSNIWYRPAGYNNVGWTTTSGDDASLVNFSLPAALNGESNIELVIADFAEEDGNGFLGLGPVTIEAVPEPTTALLLGLGLAGLSLMGRPSGQSS